MAQPDNQANQEAHWARRTTLMFIHLGIWLFFGYIIHMFVNSLNKFTIPILGFPLGFYMAAQGSLIVFVTSCCSCSRDSRTRSTASTVTLKKTEGGSTMATQTTTGADAFYKQLGRMYGTYTGGFLGFILLLAILEQIGVPNRILGYLFVFFTLAVYAVIGIATRTAQVSEYYVAGRRVPAFYNGMATGADWMSAASFVAMAGSLFLQGYDGLAWVLGWTGGFVLVSILVGPYLRKFGAYTVPDFLSFRYGGNFARFLGVIVLVCCSFTYVTAQIFGTGIIASRFLGMQFEIAVFAGLVGILACAMLGGMRAVTWTQIAQYIVLIVAYLTPIVILSTQHYGIPIPELTYGKAIADITAREQRLVQAGLATLCTAADCGPTTLKPHIQPFMNYTPLNFFGIIFCMMVGTASLPHILMRYFTTPSVKEARDSVGMVAALHLPARTSRRRPMRRSRSSRSTPTSSAAISTAIRPWLFTWGELGLIQICGKNAASLHAVIDACKAIAGHPGVLRFQDFVINTDVIVLSTPEIAGLPYVISGLVAAGGLAAALSTADGLLLAIANALEPRRLLQDDPALADRRHGTSSSAIMVVGRGAGIYLVPGHSKPGPSTKLDAGMVAGGCDTVALVAARRLAVRWPSSLLPSGARRTTSQSA